MSGSKPSIPSKGMMIPRLEIAANVSKLFLPEPTSKTEFLRFGVVIGPSGSGKTSAIQDMCCKYPEGALYYEIGEPDNFISALSKEIGMKTLPTTFIDLALSYVSTSYCHYHQLLESQVAGLDMVLKVLSDVAKLYTRKSGKVPLLCINGVDVLAKRNEKLCSALISLAKLMASTNILKVVLVSSEGTIMPFLEKLSAVNRCLVYEIGEAMAYLPSQNVKQDAAKKIISCVGGRLVYLHSCVNPHNLQKLNFNFDHVCNEIKVALFSRNLSTHRSAIEMTKPESSSIIKALAKCSSIPPHNLIHGADDKQKMHDVITTMINNNILRYDKEGKIKWHGKAQQDELAVIDWESEGNEKEKR